MTSSAIMYPAQVNLFPRHFNHKVRTKCHDLIGINVFVLLNVNRPFPSRPKPLARLSAKSLLWKWFFILMQMKLIFTRKILHLGSFWKWEFFGTRKWPIRFPHISFRKKRKRLWRHRHWCIINLSLIKFPDFYFMKLNKELWYHRL